MLVIGLNADGSVLGYEVAESSETPGLGTQIAESDFKNQFTGKNVSSFTAVKGKTSADSDIAVISGATISSKAVVEGMNLALAAYPNVKGGGFQMSHLKFCSNGIIKRKPSICPASRHVPDSCGHHDGGERLGMGLATTFVLVCSNIVISLVRNLSQKAVRLPCFIVIIAGLSPSSALSCKNLFRICTVRSVFSFLSLR